MTALEKVFGRLKKPLIGMIHLLPLPGSPRYGGDLRRVEPRATTEVGHISVFGDREFVFNAEDPEQAYGELIDLLVNQVTRDFHVRRVRRPLPR